MNRCVIQTKQKKKSKKNKPHQTTKSPDCQSVTTQDSGETELLCGREGGLGTDIMHTIPGKDQL